MPNKALFFTEQGLLLFDFLGGFWPGLAVYLPGLFVLCNRSITRRGPAAKRTNRRKESPDKKWLNLPADRQVAKPEFR